MYRLILYIAEVCFYGISTIVGYLMPNPINKYILNVYIYVICKLTMDIR